jgi:hypothetical protein
VKNNSVCAVLGDRLHWQYLGMCVQVLPGWLTSLQLTNLDVSYCRIADISVTSELTSLEVLTLQVCLSPSHQPHAALDRIMSTWLLCRMAYQQTQRPESGQSTAGTACLGSLSLAAGAFALLSFLGSLSD